MDTSKNSNSPSNEIKMAVNSNVIGIVNKGIKFSINFRTATPMDTHNSDYTNSTTRDRIT